MTLEVHKNHIFVELLDQNTGKIILPPIFQKSLETVQRGRVEACGPQSFVKPGEVILFEKWAGDAIELNGKKLLRIQPSNLIAVE